MRLSRSAPQLCDDSKQAPGKCAATKTMRAERVMNRRNLLTEFGRGLVLAPAQNMVTKTFEQPGTKSLEDTAAYVQGMDRPSSDDKQRLLLLQKLIDDKLADQKKAV